MAGKTGVNDRILLRTFILLACLRESKLIYTDRDEKIYITKRTLNHDGGYSQCTD